MSNIMEPAPIITEVLVDADTVLEEEQIESHVIEPAPMLTREFLILNNNQTETTYFYCVYFYRNRIAVDNSEFYVVIKLAEGAEMTVNLSKYKDPNLCYMPDSQSDMCWKLYTKSGQLTSTYYSKWEAYNRRRIVLNNVIVKPPTAGRQVIYSVKLVSKYDYGPVPRLMDFRTRWLCPGQCSYRFCNNCHPTNITAVQIEPMMNDGRGRSFNSTLHLDGHVSDGPGNGWYSWQGGEHQK